MTIFIIVPVHNRLSLTRECLLSLVENNGNDFCIIVVDDGSTDGTREMILNEFPEVVLLNGEGDLWWTGAMNKGVNYVLGISKTDDKILALNDDLIVPKEYVKNLNKLSSCFTNTLIGSVVLDKNDRDTILSGGININWLNAKRHNLDAGKSLSLYREGFYNQVSVLTGRGVLIPINVFRELGLYNEKHFRHYGDTELSKRAQKAGYKLIVSYDSIVYSLPSRDLIFNKSEKYSLRDLKKYFWDIRSNSDLRVRYWFAYDTSANLFYGTLYLLFDLARITFHFIRNLRMLS